jgi:hypothetical protein
MPWPVTLFPRLSYFILAGVAVRTPVPGSGVR